MTTHASDDGLAASSKFMMSSILVVSSSDDEDDGTATSSVVHAPLMAKNVNQCHTSTSTGTTKQKKITAASPTTSAPAPRRALPSPDTDSGRRRTSVSFTASSSVGSSLIASSELDGLVVGAAAAAAAASNSTRRRHRPRQTSFVESDGRVTPLEPSAPPSVPPTVSVPSSRETGAVVSTPASNTNNHNNNPQHPPLAPLHPGLPPAATLSTAHTTPGIGGPRVPRLPNASGSYSLRPDLTDVEAVALLPSPPVVSTPKQLPEDGPVVFNALQMTSLCQSGLSGPGDEGFGAVDSRDVSRSPSLAAEHVFAGLRPSSHGSPPHVHRGPPCLFYEMGFCECRTHPVPAAREGEQTDPPTEAHLIGVASVVHQLLRDHQRLAQQCRALEVRCDQQALCMQDLQREVDRLRHRGPSPSSRLSASPPLAPALPSVTTTAGPASLNGEVSALPGAPPAPPPVTRRESMYVQRLRERTHSAQHLYDRTGSGGARREDAAGVPPALSVEAIVPYAPEDGKVLADALQTPKSYGRTARSTSYTQRSGSSGTSGRHGDAGGGVSAMEAALSGATASHSPTHHNSSISSERSPTTRAVHCFPSYRRDDSLSSISQPSSDLLETADEPEEAYLLQRMMSNAGTPLTEAVSLADREVAPTRGAGKAGAEQPRGGREARFSPPSLSLISTTHRPAQFARALGPLAGVHEGSEARTGAKQVPSPTRSPTITARGGRLDVDDDDTLDGVHDSIRRGGDGMPRTASPRPALSPPVRHRDRAVPLLPSLSPVNTSLGAPALMMTKTAVLQRAPTIVARQVMPNSPTTAAMAVDRHSTSYADASDAPRLPRATSAAGGKLSARGVRTVCSQSNLKEFEKQQRQLEEEQRRAQK